MYSLGLGIVICALVAMLCGANPAWGQDVTASVTGSVTDSSGAPLAGALVTAKDMDRGTTWPSTTNNDGLYNILRIPVGTYSLRVEAKGFHTTLIPPFTLVLNQTARIDVQMKVGSVTETVQVTGVAPVLQTESTEVSMLIDSKTLTTLPLASRNYIQLALLSPGVATNNPDALMTPHIMTDEGRPFINGNREQAIEFFLDGVINDEEKNNEVAYQPNADAIQEFNLIAQNPGADFGNYAGGVISVSIKSGTNQFHGDAFEFFRNDALNSNQRTSTWNNGFAPKNRLRYNQFGGTFGGPILKDKLFFFADYQGFRFPTAGTSSAQLLTGAERSGDFSDWCTQNGGTVSAAGCSNPTYSIMDPVHGVVAPFNCLAATCGGNAGAGDTASPFISSLTSNFVKYYPVPTNNVATGDNINFASGNTFNSDQGDLRIDFRKSDKDSFFDRYSKWHTSRAPFSGLLFSAQNSNAAVPADQPGWSNVTSWTHVFNPNLMNEARLGINVFRFFQNVTLTSGLGPIANQMLGISGPGPVTSLNGQQGGLPFISIGQTAVFKGDASLGDPMILQNFNDTYIQYEDNVVITSGRHTITTGFQYIRERLNWLYAGNNGALGTVNIGSNTSSGAIGGDPLADFWLGNITGGGGRDSGLGGGLYHFNRGSIIGAFVQDNWKITSALTLNLGLRFEDHTPFLDKQDHVVNFGLNTGTIETPGNGNSRALYDNYMGIGNWQPRIGFAWSPSALHGKTVLRGAYGVSSYREGGGANEELQMNLPYGTITQSSPATTGVQALNSSFAWPGLPANCAQPSFACYAGSRIRIYPKDFRPASIQQWNFAIQHQLTKSLTAQIGYVGQKGTHLINFQDVAQMEGLNAQGKIAKPGQLITSYVPGPFLGGQMAGATPANNLYYSDNPALGGKEALAGINEDNGTSRYDSLQAVLKEQSWHGLTAQVAYTYSKCLTNSPGYFGVAGGGWTTQATTESSSGIYGTQNIYDPHSDWGPCYYDETHILSSYLFYEIPVGKGKQFGNDLNPVVNEIIGNWQIAGIISAHSGNALTLNYFGGWGSPAGPGPSSYGDASGTNGIGPYTLSERPNCNGPIKILNQFVPAVTSGPNQHGAYIQYFDTTNIGPPALGTFGTCGVGNIRGPRDQNWDLSLQKQFGITESKKLEFRVDFLNAFNYTHWTFAGSVWNGSFSAGAWPIPGNSGSANTGKIVSSQGARQIQLGLKFIF
jgi:hypothetical protein